uniref:Uncharacterized protein n=1 Tax=viral metagenome TaxID=1070528 RepID=A0A6M3KZG6_9ZZZZ
MICCDLTQECRHELRVELRLTAPNGFLTVFPRSEKYLSDIDHMMALQYLASKKRYDRYRSIMDFVFCELFPHWKPYCFAFYREKEKRLKDIMKKDELVRYDRRILIALTKAYNWYCDKREQSWSGFMNEINP